MMTNKQVAVILITLVSFFIGAVFLLTSMRQPENRIATAPQAQATAAGLDYFAYPPPGPGPSIQDAVKHAPPINYCHNGDCRNLGLNR